MRNAKVARALFAPSGRRNEAAVAEIVGWRAEAVECVAASVCVSLYVLTCVSAPCGIDKQFKYVSSRCSPLKLSGVHREEFGFFGRPIADLKYHKVCKSVYFIGR